VAEGVETKEQLEFLQAHECDEGQGYYFSHPVPPDTFADLLRTGIGLDFDPARSANPFPEATSSVAGVANA
jgi:predicted signal transduction protein with EAL and GGDEF domain